MDDQAHIEVPAERRLGARGEAFTKYVTLFGLVFAAGFAVVLVVVLSRRKRTSR